MSVSVASIYTGRSSTSDSDYASIASVASVIQPLECSRLQGLRHGDPADFWPKLSRKLVVATLQLTLIHSVHFL